MAAGALDGWLAGWRPEGERERGSQEASEPGSFTIIDEILNTKPYLLH